MSRTTLDVDRVLSGHSGELGRRAKARARIGDLIDLLRLWGSGVPLRLSRAARRSPVRSVLVLGIYGDQGAPVIAKAVRRLRTSRHRVRIVLGALDASFPELAAETAAAHLRGGKFENLNHLLSGCSVSEFDWVIVIDDDVRLPRRFLDEFIYISEGFGFQLCQPAQTKASHAAWHLFRRRRGLIARQTRMVEIGPVTAIRRDLIAQLLPFPSLKMGWGLDVHWGALALERNWMLGVVDATAVRHEMRPPAAGYDRAAARAEAAEFLAAREHLERETASQTVREYPALPPPHPPGG